MTSTRGRGGIALAVILALAGLAVAWLAIRTTAIRVLPAETPILATLAPNSSAVAFDRAMTEFETRGGRVSPPVAAAAEQAARNAPLEASPYLLAAVRDLLQHRDDRALVVLEAGRRLDPRDRWINLLLLDRYLRLHRYNDSVEEFALLARLVGPADETIAGMLAQMAVDPATRGPVRQTLARDPGLELAVLSVLATSNASPQLVLSLASPHAVSVAGAANGWGGRLIARLVDQGQFATARQVWQRVYRIADAQAADPIYDAALLGAPGGPPFGWDLASGSIGGVAMQGRQLSIDYYGRDSGALASQLLTLRPGRYRFAFQFSGSADQGAAVLHWTVTCAGGDKPPVLADLALPTPKAAPRPLAFDFTVPTRCGAQWLRLTGAAGEFPAPVNAAIDHLVLEPAGAAS